MSWVARKNRIETRIRMGRSMKKREIEMRRKSTMSARRMVETKRPMPKTVMTKKPIPKMMARTQPLKSNLKTTC